MNCHGLCAFPRHSARSRCLAWTGCGRILLGDVRRPAAFNLAAGLDRTMPMDLDIDSELLENALASGDEKTKKATGNRVSQEFIVRRR